MRRREAWARQRARQLVDEKELAWRDALWRAGREAAGLPVLIRAASPEEIHAYARRQQPQARDIVRLLDRGDLDELLAEGGVR